MSSTSTTGVCVVSVMETKDATEGEALNGKKNSIQSFKLQCVGENEDVERYQTDWGMLVWQVESWPWSASSPGNRIHCLCTAAAPSPTALMQICGRVKKWSGVCHTQPFYRTLGERAKQQTRGSALGGSNLGDCLPFHSWVKCLLCFSKISSTLLLRLILSVQRQHRRNMKPSAGKKKHSPVLFLLVSHRAGHFHQSNRGDNMLNMWS